MSVTLKRATNGIHKFVAIFPDGKKVRFGRKGYSDYTIHKNAERMRRYLTRHRKRENWSPSGRYTSGFWSRRILWSEPSLKGALTRTSKVLGKK
ncbi:hypothetical protein [Yellowstone lake phycodnavirus 3]|uniref:hypothetical protein n=1 Tax=Yellowstone lake phycodnavirus 3 TaxID=1586715 RepID=UPI0006EBCC3A|nr:hypothetical protein AR677_gp059 [Yellowstone lake phycodnavirus 3]BAT22558.1 hypothetical protein [Yellowstone lake phycodnavirus 3]